MKKFYSNDGPGAFPWRGCDIQARQLTDVLRSFPAGAVVHGRSSLLQPLPDQPWLFFDCAVSHDAPVPVLVGGPGADIRPGLESIGELVATWTELIEIGAFAVADGGWTWDVERIPAEVRALGVFCRTGRTRTVVSTRRRGSFGARRATVRHEVWAVVADRDGQAGVARAASIVSTVRWRWCRGCWVPPPR